MARAKNQPVGLDDDIERALGEAMPEPEIAEGTDDEDSDGDGFSGADEARLVNAAQQAPTTGKRFWPEGQRGEDPVGLVDDTNTEDPMRPQVPQERTARYGGRTDRAMTYDLGGRLYIILDEFMYDGISYCVVWSPGERNTIVKERALLRSGQVEPGDRAA